MTLNVIDKTICLQREPRADEVSSDNLKYEKRDLTNPELVDKEIEADDYRRRLPDREGNIAITVQPGDELGQLSVNVQFEGPKGAHEFCMQEQNELLLNASEWMKEILGVFDADFDIRIEGKPCPHAEQKLQVENAAMILQKKKKLAEAIKEVRSQKVKAKHGASLKLDRKARL